MGLLDSLAGGMLEKVMGEKVLWHKWQWICLTKTAA